jgi:hypothetical protein
VPVPNSAKVTACRATPFPSCIVEDVDAAGENSITCGDLCFRNLERKNATNADTMAVDMQHHGQPLPRGSCRKSFSRMWTTNSIGV